MPKPYKPNDKWAQRAAKEGFRARSVYKLMEIDEKCRLFRKGMTVLDLGAAPGSWLQYASKKVGADGTVVGVDLKEIEPFEEEQNIITTQMDITDVESLKQFLTKNDLHTVDIVISDLAPNTSGIWDVDQWRSVELSHAVLLTAENILSASGSCVLKVFRGADFNEFLEEVKEHWQKVKIIDAKASRDRSKEIYLVLQHRIKPLMQ